MQLTDQQQWLKAPQSAARVHKHQERKDGTPYIGHCTRVAMRVALNYQFGSPACMKAMTAAFLHDVVEDTDYTFDDLRDAGYGEVVVAVVDRLTRRTGETYADFILRCKGDGLSEVSLLAIQVKLADIADNMEDQSALDPEDAEFLSKRYTKAQKVLSDS